MLWDSARTTKKLQFFYPIDSSPTLHHRDIIHHLFQHLSFPHILKQFNLALHHADQLPWVLNTYPSNLQKLFVNYRQFSIKKTPKTSADILTENLRPLRLHQLKNKLSYQYNGQTHIYTIPTFRQKSFWQFCPYSGPKWNQCSKILLLYRCTSQMLWVVIII